MRRLRLAPLPTAEDRLTLEALIAAPTFATADIYAGGNPSADPGTKIPVPAPYALSVFLPVVLQRLTGSPYWKNAEAQPEIKRQYDAARQILAKLYPQGSDGLPAVPAAPAPNTKQ